MRKILYIFKNLENFLGFLFYFSCENRIVYIIVYIYTKNCKHKLTYNYKYQNDFSLSLIFVDS